MVLGYGGPGMSETDLPPEPGSPAWDRWAEDQLDDVDFDTELGKEMAADARRLADGTLSEAEFHSRYAGEVEREFGVDERPTKSAAVERDEAGEPMPRVPSDRGETRRRVLQAIGGAAAIGAAGLAGCIGTGDEDEQAANPAEIEEPDTQLGMVIDTTRCIACLQCSEACKSENNTDIGVHWPYVFRYTDDRQGEDREGYLTRHCQHCSEPSCTYVCPTQARYQRTDDGIVLTDYDTCVGCKYCQVACPYGVNYLGKDEPNPDVGTSFEADPTGRDDRTVAGPPPKGVMGKCTFCVHRQDADAVDNGVDADKKGSTACQEACPEDVIRFGDMNDPESDPRQYLRGEIEGREDAGDRNQYKLLNDVGNEPNIVFLGQKPSKDARPIQGPRAYDDMGMRDGNYDYVTQSEGDAE